MGALLLIERFSGGWDVLICNILALCVSGIANFVLNEHVVFRKVDSK
jgi:putative flippase GtrA